MKNRGFFWPKTAEFAILVLSIIGWKILHSHPHAVNSLLLLVVPLVLFKISKTNDFTAEFHRGGLVCFDWFGLF